MGKGRATMTDIIDRANDSADTLLQDAIARQRRRSAERHLPPCGSCYGCFADLQDQGARFCDAECVRLFERDESARRRNGSLG